MYEFLKKKYGQNFLIDKNILKKISNLIPSNNLNIIEIGPGDGKLTDYIIETNPKKLWIVEIDQDLVPNLDSKYKKLKNVKIIKMDFLKFSISEKFDLILSNLPYNISSQVLEKICLLKEKPDYLIFMFQKEFAERLLSKKLNSLNALVNCFFDIELNFNVGKYCFRPIPKVESSVVFFKRRTESLLKKKETEQFIIFKRNIFSHKRKTLNKTLKNYKKELFDIDLTLRPENLELNDLIKIFKKINI